MQMQFTSGGPPPVIDVVSGVKTMPGEKLVLQALPALELFEDKQAFPLPRIIPLAQSFPRPRAGDLRRAVRNCCRARNLRSHISPGMRVAVAAGSRGISGIADILKALVECLKGWGAEVAVIPAMGSHGGPSGKGQAELLAGYGIDENAMGAPVISSLEVKRLGYTGDGLAVWFSADALAFDQVIVVNRVKPHSDFCGSIESGLMKICAVGLGKHKGASYIHSLGFPRLGESIKSVARIMLREANILGGLAIVENAYKEVAKVDFLYRDELEEKEAALLREARALMPSLPLAEMDFLLVQRIGKDISGAMFDPNITGRRKIWGVADLDRPRVGVMAALELTPASHGNAAGLSVADLCSLRLIKSVDFAATYASLITATLPQHAHIPMFFDRDDEIVRAAAKISRYQDPWNAILCWVRDTGHIDRLWVSERALPLVADRPGVSVLGPARDIPFDSRGLLAWMEPEEASSHLLPKET